VSVSLFHAFTRLVSRDSGALSDLGIALGSWRWTGTRRVPPAAGLKVVWAGTWDTPSFGAQLAISVNSLFGHHLRLLGPNPANWTSKPIG
jgi:hypothetical protein